MNLLSKKIVSFLFVASLLFADGLAMEERQPTPEEQLFAACRFGDLDVVRKLLKHPRIDVNRRGGYNKRTPFHVACCNGYLEIVKELLKHQRIDVNRRGSYHKGTPFHVACCRGHIEIVKELLKHPRIDVNKGGEDGRTPLYIACFWGHIEIVKVLLTFGADFRIRDNKGKTALDIARDERGEGIFDLDIVRDEDYEKIIRALENPLFTAVCGFGVRGVEVYIEMDVFDLYKKYEYKVMIDGKEKTLKLIRVHIAESMLQKFEYGLSKIFLQEKKAIELRENVVKIKEIINLLKTLLPTFEKELKKMRDGRKFCDCVVVVKII